jgi:hypothetical protein
LLAQKALLGASNGTLAPQKCRFSTLKAALKGAITGTKRVDYYR